MKKLKTAVYFLEEIASKGFISPENFEQSKEIFKKQITDAYREGIYHNTIGNLNFESEEDYYTETYGK